MSESFSMSASCAIEPTRLFRLLPDGEYRDIAPNVPWARRRAGLTEVCVEREGRQEILSVEERHEGDISGSGESDL
jgi:hypothetical protein